MTILEAPPERSTSLKNAVILGCGRSGTSLVAGSLSDAGYYMGSRLYPGSESNPKGYFESDEINRINEDLIAQVDPKRPRFWGRWFFRSRPLAGQRWLSRLSLGTSMAADAGIRQRIQDVTSKVPFCFKDPRFSYTLPVWRPYLKDAVFVCVFRDPAETAFSILTECRRVPYLRTLSMNFKTALEVWYLNYRHILDIHRREGEWLFVHYHQMLEREGLERLRQFLGAAVDPSFPDARLNRSRAHALLLPHVRKTYQELLALSER